MQTSSINVAIKYVGPLVVYKSIDPHNHLLMILDGKILRGLFEHERLKPATIGKKSGKHVYFIAIKTDSKYRYEDVIIISL